MRKVRDELAADIAATYPGIVASLTALAKRIVDSDRECARVGIRETAEAIGRGLPINFYRNGAPLHRIAERPVATVDGTRLAWEDSPFAGWQWPGLAPQAGEQAA